MRKLVLGILGFAAFGFGAASFQPAQAQPYYPGYRQGVAVEYRGDHHRRWSEEHRGYRPGVRAGALSRRLSRRLRPPAWLLSPGLRRPDLLCSDAARLERLALGRAAGSYLPLDTIF